MRRDKDLRILRKIWRFFWARKDERPLVKTDANGDSVPMNLNELGVCEPPDVKGKRIIIRDCMGLELLLDTFIHEQIHAAAHELLSEEWINATSSDIARNILLYFEVRLRKK